jgi:hypothetical protein
VRLGDALRANTSLTALSLIDIGLWSDVAAAAALFSALEANPRLRTLSLQYNRSAKEEQCASATLSGLLLANGAALQELDLRGWNWATPRWARRAGTAPQHAPALPGLQPQRHERGVHAPESLLPAVRANTSLRKLVAESRSQPLVEAVALVAARAAASS